MFKTNTITVFNRVLENRTYKYLPTIVPNVHIENMGGARRRSEGYVSDGGSLFIIPYKTEGYVSPVEYNKLENKTGSWTLDPHSIIIKGIHNEPITDMGELKDEYEIVVKVYEVSVYDHFGNDLDHLEVIGNE